MRRLLILLLPLLSLTTFGQPGEDHLEPTDGYFNMYGFLHDYYPFIYEHLIKDLSDNPVARMLMLSSFSPENVVSIESADSEEKSYKVIFKECKENLWYKENKNTIEVTAYEQDIDTATVNLVRKVFKKVFFKTSYYDNNLMGPDGVRYIFTGFVLDSGIRTGEVWSPDEGTKMDELVGLGESLIRLAKANNDDDRLKFNKEIKDKGQRLLKRLRSE